MSLYKTQRCRHFDEAGNHIKPYCSQGNKCRFIHPNDHQWAKLKRGTHGTPSPEDREAVRTKGKNKLQLSPGNSLQCQRSSPLIPQTDLFKRKQKDVSRGHDHRDWSVQDGDRRRDSDSWGHAQERSGPLEQGCPLKRLKRANDEGDPYPNQRPRLSERILYESASGNRPNNTRHAIQTDRINTRVSECDPKMTANISDSFHRLAKLCCEIVQDTCFLDREEDKLKAFTGLSSELSRAVPDAAMAVTPVLATVIAGHTRTRKRLENHVEELETLWKTLFCMLENDISKVIDSRLEQAMALLDKERESALRVMTRSQRLTNDRLHEGTAGPRQWTDGWKGMVTDKTTTLLDGGATFVNGRPAINTSLEETRHHGGSTSLSPVPTREGDLGTSLKIVLEDMKMQMDRQTRAIELLAKENLQLKSATEHLPPQFVPPDSISSFPEKTVDPLRRSLYDSLASDWSRLSSSTNV